MGATAEGTIIQLGQAIGFKKALQSWRILLSRGRRTLRKCLMITHCNNPAKAESVRQMI